MTTLFSTFREASLWLLSGLVVAGLRAGPVEIGERLEPFVDSHLIDRMDGVAMQPGRPIAQEIVFHFDRPWEAASPGFVTVLKDGETYRMYYRGGSIFDARGNATDEVVCYAESRDGIRWERPELGLHEVAGTRLNNVILLPGPLPRVTHNFAPMLDDRPEVPLEERYKAVGGRREGGLFLFVSPDGIRWKPRSDQPLFVNYALDSLNVILWSPAEQCYAIYLRTWSEGGTPEQPRMRGFRTISRSTSTDLVNWSKPQPMDFGDTPMEHLYTQGTHPYYRAPHILVALPYRFRPDRRVLSEDEMNAFGVRAAQRQGVSDAVLMTSRGGTTFDRTFMESFIRSGLDRRSWHARNTKPAKGIVPTGADEMSLYIATHNTLISSHIRRYSLPVDRLASVNAPYRGGSMTTKPLVFAGKQLSLNYSTSSAGSVRVELLDGSGHVLPGYAAEDCDELIGDMIAQKVTWRGASDIGALAGRVVRVRFVMQDADLYALKFGES